MNQCKAAAMKFESGNGGNFIRRPDVDRRSRRQSAEQVAEIAVRGLVQQQRVNRVVRIANDTTDDESTFGNE
jgi:hypothetical protein